MMMRTSVAAAFVWLAACGGGAGSDAYVDALPECDYTELSDATNATMLEATGLTVDVTRTICGQVDSGHFSAGTVDVDTYQLAVPASPAELLIQFNNAQETGLTGFKVEIFDGSPNPVLQNAGTLDPTLGDHGAFLAELNAGNYEVVVTATAAADVAAPIPYKVRLVTDQPTTRCPDSTGVPKPDYVEALDTATNTGNDVMQVDFSKTTPFTLISGSSAEPTGLTVDRNKSVHISGSSGSVAAGTDKYLDRDTYEITTGERANELSIRLNWPGATSDLDYVVFQENQTTATATATLTSSSEDEFNTFAVLPSTKYWIWVGAYDGSTGLPVAYDMTVCGGDFNP